jgi:hypothetical protein
MPLLVWHGAKLSVDGNEVQDEGDGLAEVGEELRVGGGPFGAAYALSVPEGVPCRVRGPLAAQPTHSNFFEEDTFRPAFRIALACSQWEKPPRTGSAVWTLTVQ